MNSIETNNVDELELEYLRNAGAIYFKTKQYDLMKEILLFGVMHNDIQCINNLAIYYREVEKNSGLMTFYLFKGMSLGSSESMFLLGWYYTNIDNNLMEQYYLAAIQKNQNSLISVSEWHAQMQAYNYLLEYYIKNNDFVSLQKTIRTDIDLMMHIEYQIPFEYLINIPLRYMAYEYVPRSFLKDKHLQITHVHKNNISYMCIVNDN